MASKGNNFTPEDDLALARVWLNCSRRPIDQNAETFWADAAEAFNKEPTVIVSRTMASLKCRWTTLQRVSQKYLAASKLYRANIPSGETEEDTLKNIMTLYREKNKKTVDGKVRVPQVLKSLQAVMLLSEHPKFSQTVGGGSSGSSPGYRSPDGSGSGPSGPNASSFQSGRMPLSLAGNIDMTSPSSHRPAGSKRQKQENAVEAGAYKMAKSIDGVGSAIKENAASRSLSASVALKFKILMCMQLPQDEMNKRLQVLFEEASSIPQLTAPASSSTNDAEDRSVSQNAAEKRQEDNLESH